MSSGAGGRDEALFEILGPYLEAVEAGRAPDREELLARNPEHREHLEACLTSLDALHATGGRGPPALSGETLGDYEVGPEIGRGGMGIVYEARQVSLDRSVALKVLLTPALLDPARLRRFQTEAVAAAHLQHPHIVPVHAVGCEEGIHFYAMQRIEGMTLAEVIGTLRGGEASPRPEPIGALVGEGPVTATTYVRACARLAKDATEALEHAHRRGIVHRDVKPANLILDRTGHVFVADFGLASFRTEGTGITLSGDLVGTLRYMSPEQARAHHEAVDHRTDIYSLGVTLYELLTLERAFPGESAPDLIEAITKRTPVSLRRKNRAVPAALETIVTRAMAREPDGRYATAGELAADLERFLAGRPVSARTPPRLASVGRGIRSRPALSLSGIVLLALIVLGALLRWMGPPEEGVVRRPRIAGVTAPGGEVVVRREEARRLRGEARSLRAKGAEAAACARYRAAADLLREAPGSLDDRLGIVMCLQGEAGACLNLGSPEDSLRLLDESIPIGESLVGEKPENPKHWNLLAGMRFQRAQALWALDRPEAEGAFRAAIECLEDCPLPASEFRQRRWKTAIQRYQYGLMLRARGESESARELFRQAVGGPVRDFTECAFRAWILVMCPDEAVRDPARAVGMARRALEKESTNLVFRLILGAALLRAGEPTEAIVELESIWTARAELNRCGIDAYLLSIACSKAGRPVDARRWLDRASDRDPRLGRTIAFSIAEVRALGEEAAALVAEREIVPR